MNFSSATIRSEMADLTAMGYLEQPHTSAGRIPSPAGYRLYVDELMQDYRLSVDETKSINNAIEEKVQRVDKLVEKVAKLVSQATDLPAISAASRCDSATVSRFDLIQAGQGSFILVVMLSDDQVFNKLIKLPVSVDETDLKLLAALLNTAMTELPPEGFTREQLTELPFILREKGSGTRNLFEHVMNQHHLQCHVTGSYNNTESIRQAVAAGLGISAISSRLVAKELQEGKLASFTIPGITFRRSFRIVYHKNKYLTAGLKTFIDLCKSYI